MAVMINRAFEDGKLFTQVEGRALPGWASDIGVTSWAQIVPQVRAEPPRRHRRDPGNR